MIENDMSKQDFGACRLFVEAISPGPLRRAFEGRKTITFAMCCASRTAPRLRVFNGRDGEWLARLAGRRQSERQGSSSCEMTRPQTTPGDLHLLFAPLKQARLDYMVQKAVEMGVSRLVPVITRHTQVDEAQSEARLRANVIEAAEQCGILSLPDDRLAASRSRKRLARSSRIASSSSATRPPNATIRFARSAGRSEAPLAVLIGPEGGFAEEERRALLARPERFASRSARASCGPTPPPWPRSLSCRPVSGIGARRAG